MEGFYDFLLDMWVRKKVTAVKIQTYVPKYVTQTEADTIIATPQTV